MRGEVGGRWRCRGTSLNQIFSCRLDGPHAAEVSVRLDVRPLFLGGPVTRARRVEADRLRAHAASTRECGEQSVEVDMFTPYGPTSSKRSRAARRAVAPTRSAAAPSTDSTAGRPGACPLRPSAIDRRRLRARPQSSRRRRPPFGTFAAAPFAHAWCDVVRHDSENSARAREDAWAERRQADRPSYPVGKISRHGAEREAAGNPNRCEDEV